MATFFVFPACFSQFWFDWRVFGLDLLNYLGKWRDLVKLVCFTRGRIWAFMARSLRTLWKQGFVFNSYYMQINWFITSFVFICWVQRRSTKDPESYFCCVLLPRDWLGQAVPRRVVKRSPTAIFRPWLFQQSEDPNRWIVNLSRNISQVLIVAILVLLDPVYGLSLLWVVCTQHIGRHLGALVN